MQTKTCCRCRVAKSITDFRMYKRAKDGLQPYCITCGKEYKAEWYGEHRATIIRRTNKNRSLRVAESRKQLLLYKQTHGCVDCPETDPIVLQFDHVRGKKQQNISTLVGRGIAWSSVLKEIAKCEVRCANCHQRKTAKERTR